MTIICAYRSEGETAIASDSAGTDGWGYQECYGSKLHEFEFGFLGFSGSYQMVPFVFDALENTRSLENPGEARQFSKKVWEAMIQGGWEDKGGKEGLPKNEQLAILIISRGGRIWTLQSDFAVLESKQYAAIGSGAFASLGALEVLRSRKTPAMAAVAKAVNVAIKLVSTCGGEIHSKLVSPE